MEYLLLFFYPKNVNTEFDDVEEKDEYEEENDVISLKKEQEKNQLTKIGNKSYDINEMNGISIVRLTQCGIS